MYHVLKALGLLGCNSLLVALYDVVFQADHRAWACGLFVTAVEGAFLVVQWACGEEPE